MAYIARIPFGFWLHPKCKWNLFKPFVGLKYWKSLNIVIKHVFICSNPYIYTTVVQEVYNRDRSPEVDDVEGLSAATTKHLELLKQKDKPESSFFL